MRLDFEWNVYTLDYDKCDKKELLKRMFFILKDPTTMMLKYRKSCRGKGYHVVVGTNVPVNVAKYRRKYKDDPKRLMHDILNRPDHIHDILWTQKRIRDKVYRAGRWSRWIS